MRTRSSFAQWMIFDHAQRQRLSRGESSEGCKLALLAFSGSSSTPSCRLIAYTQPPGAQRITLYIRVRMYLLCLLSGFQTSTRDPVGIGSVNLLFQREGFQCNDCGERAFRMVAYDPRRDSLRVVTKGDRYLPRATERRHASTICAERETESRKRSPSISVKIIPRYSSHSLVIAPFSTDAAGE